MMSENNEYINPVEFEIAEARKRNNMSKKDEELEKYKALYQETLRDLDDYKNLYLRQRSEMENYTKYKEREINNIRKNAAVGSFIILFTVRPAIAPASFVACLWLSSKYAGTVITASLTGSPRKDSASFFIF